MTYGLLNTSAKKKLREKEEGRLRKTRKKQMEEMVRNKIGGEYLCPTGGESRRTACEGKAYGFPFLDFFLRLCRWRYQADFHGLPTGYDELIPQVHEPGLFFDFYLAVSEMLSVRSGSGSDGNISPADLFP